MVDTVRTRAALQTLLADNTTGDISPQDLRDFLVSAYPLWQDFTPTWTADSANPTLGNGTLTGRYIQFGTGTGSLVIARVNLTIGSTTANGTGEWKWALPITAASERFAGAVYVLDNGTTYRTGAAIIPTDTTVVKGVATASARIGPTVPQTWATGDQLTLQIAYESA